MDRRSLVGSLACILVPPGVSAGKNSDQHVPVLVELFTSQGCSSCPPADDLLSRLVTEQPVPGAEIIGLSQHVDYWDRLGWKDPFSSAENTRRQLRYQRKFQTESIYTPQMVVDGVTQFVGSDVRAALSAIRQSCATSKPSLSITLGSDRAIVVVPPVDNAKRARLVAAIVLPEAENPVLRGENRGRTLRHRNVQSQVLPSREVSLSSRHESRVEVPVDGLAELRGKRIVAFLQDSRTLRVLSATSVPG